MPAHNVFSEIDARSYASIVKNGWLSEVILALLVDPLEAADVAESIKSATGTAIELKLNGRVFEAPIGLSDFQNLPSKDAFEKLKITLSQWAMTMGYANVSLRTIAEWDRRFGAWCACAVARDALRFVPRNELRPLRAIETTESWVLGMATAESAAGAAYAAATAGAAYSSAADAAAYSAAYASNAASNDAAAAAAADAASASADAAARASNAVAWTSNRSAELVRLCEVVSNACLTFPG
jgi:hypothetical protein